MLQKKSKSEDLLPPPNSEEDRITTPTSAPILSDCKELDLKDCENLKKNELKKYFRSITEHNKSIFCQAVEQNKKELVKNILAINTDLIDVKTKLEGHNILHKALAGIVDVEMVKILLENEPYLVARIDNQSLNPYMFGERYGFGIEAQNEQNSKIKKVIEHYEKKVASGKVPIRESKSLFIKDTKETPDSLKFLQYLYDKGNEENLKLYIAVNLKQNKDVFYQAVMSNKKKLVKKILSYNPKCIDYTNSEGHNVLHIALKNKAKADAEMIEILLQCKPKLITEKNKENLTPLMFGEKYGFSEVLSKKEIDKIKAILKDYERDAIRYDSYLPDPPNEKMVDFEDELLGNNLGGVNGTEL
ncbi:Ankyrin repeat [Rickettsia bellii OSU 85-389]|nr:ankyrin repeat domain-containing protein [Rickettsia bellii]ABV78741.1 Ankyrin repeat [Rickettsia bellii OSU 85-389]